MQGEGNMLGSPLEEFSPTFLYQGTGFVPEERDGTAHPPYNYLKISGIHGGLQVPQHWTVSLQLLWPQWSLVLTLIPAGADLHWKGHPWIWPLLRRRCQLHYSFWLYQKSVRNLFRWQERRICIPLILIPGPSHCRLSPSCINAQTHGVPPVESTYVGKPPHTDSKGMT